MVRAFRASLLLAALAAAVPATADERQGEAHEQVAVASQTPFLFLAAPIGLPAWRPDAPYAPAEPNQANRFVAAHHIDYDYGIADYGPFRVIDETRLALIGETDAWSPYWFARVLRDFPALARLDMVECPGTRDDRANLQIGRMIRDAGLATHVPAHGSVRSGAVELFLAGTLRTIAEGAEFAVHSWRDAQGLEADDYALDAPQNRFYLDYYRELGMTAIEAQAFYAMTNSVPHSSARWLSASEMRRWANFRGERPAPKLAYLDVRHSFN